MSRSRDYRLRLGGIPGSGATNVAFDGERAVIFSGIFSVPGAMAETTVDFGLAAGPWRTFDSLTPAAATTRPAATTQFVPPPRGPDRFRVPPPPGLPPLRIRSITEKEGKTRVEFVDISYWDETKDTVWRGVVITRGGATRRIVDAEYPDGRMVFVYDVPLKNVARAEYQVRDVDWKSLGPVRMYPTTQAATTSTQLPAAPGPNLQ
jgi:hypothetical protein